MRNVIWDLEFIYDMLRKTGPVVALGGILVIVVGFLLGKYSMIIAGSIVTLVAVIDYVIFFFVGKREK